MAASTPLPSHISDMSDGSKTTSLQRVSEPLHTRNNQYTDDEGERSSADIDAGVKFPRGIMRERLCKRNSQHSSAARLSLTLPLIRAGNTLKLHGFLLYAFYHAARAAAKSKKSTPIRSGIVTSREDDCS